ncbi:MAG TPA: DUF3578 domain-containing protein [Paludibacter sp.]
MKQNFFDYIGDKESLANYQKSYKLVFLKAIFENMDEEGKVSAAKVGDVFKRYYEVRVDNGKEPDFDVDPRIRNVKESTLIQILAVIKDNPYRVINVKGFISIKKINDEDYFCLNPELVSELSENDIRELQENLDYKLKKYFKLRDESLTLYEGLNTMLENYARAKNTEPFTKNPLGDLMRKQIPKAIETLPFFDVEKYKVKGSIGQGNWVESPWIAIFDTRITTSAQSGIYIVYHFSSDGERLYLTLMQGVTALKNQYKSKGALQKLHEIGDVIRRQINPRSFKTDNKLLTGDDFFSAGTIFYKPYDKDNLPDNSKLEKDLEECLALYQDYFTVYQKQPPIIPVVVIDPLELSVSDELARIGDYIKSRGFSYEDGMIENFYLSLKTKPFVILAGTSGTGKTKLVKLFGEAIGATRENNRYLMVPVRPDWSDSSDLLGYLDLNGKFVPGSITDFIGSAMNDLDKPHILCLDEMNLARVEYYFSDFLSVMETREKNNDRLKSAELLNTNLFGQDEASRSKYEGLYIPENLYIIGTVNMDETTFPFSKKVLDRANTIELSYVDLDLILGQNITPEVSNVANAFLKTEYLYLNECLECEDILLETISTLKQINEVLSAGFAQFGYRVRDEVCFYIVNHQKNDILDQNTAMDYCILQKILPRIQGSSMSIKGVMISLFGICAGSSANLFNDDSMQVSERMFDYLKDKNIFYKKSAAKIAFMTQRLEEDGFTSYWL